MGIGRKHRSLRDAVAALARECRVQLEETLRLVELALLRLVSAIAPRSWALKLADGMGRILAVSPIGARLERRMRSAFPDADAKALTHEWLSRPFRDYVTVARIIDGRDNPATWDIISVGAPAFLQDPAQSFILATGHFSRHAATGMYMSHVVPQRLAVVIAEVDRGTFWPKALRVRFHLGSIARGLKVVRGGATEIIEAGAPGAAGRLLKHLKQPGSYAVIAADAPWTLARAGVIERPFAGRGMQSFALGAARLSRMTQRPIVTCVPFQDEKGRIVLEWGLPIPPAPREDHDADARVTSLILDTLELAVGQRPGQYVIPTGYNRTWSAADGRWIGRETLSQAAPAAAEGGGRETAASGLSQAS